MYLFHTYDLVTMCGWAKVSDVILTKQCWANVGCQHISKYLLTYVRKHLIHSKMRQWGLPWWLSSKRICLKCRRCGFDPWVGKIPWRRDWLPIPIFLPGESHGQRSLAGYSSWGRKESDTIEWLTLSLTLTFRRTKRVEGRKNIWRNMSKKF